MPRPVPATIVTAPVDATNEDPATGCCFYFGGTRLKVGLSYEMGESSVPPSLDSNTTSHSQRNAVAPAPLPTSIVKTSPTTDPTSPPRRRRPSTAQPKPTSTSSPPPIHHGTLGSNPELAASAAKSISDLRQMIGKSIGELTRTFSAHFKHHANPVMKALSIDDELRVFVGTWNMFGRVVTGFSVARTSYVYFTRHHTYKATTRGPCSIHRATALLR